MKAKTKPQSVSEILKKFNPVEDKYISREFQAYGIYLSEELSDYKHRALYIRLAKTVPRAILEKALSFVKESRARSKGKLFMWKLKELRQADQKLPKK
ncbi:hypothetical protein C4579_03825 [Candidatus Microgenomates bacterium]|nr:MAG: hypothetical protein C4579_03825 [Candidatus Microgenomates bacterium]